MFVPVDDAERLVDALAAAGAGRLGDYDRCAWTTQGTGTFRPLDGRSTGDRLGGRGRAGRRDPGRDGAARGGCDARCSPRCAPPTRTRNRPSTCSRQAAASRRARHRPGRRAAGGRPRWREFVAARRAAAAGARRGASAPPGDPDRPVRTVAAAGGSVRLPRRGGPRGRGGRLPHRRPQAPPRRRGGHRARARGHGAGRRRALGDRGAVARRAGRGAARALRHYGGACSTPGVHATVTDPWTLHAPSPSSREVSRSARERRPRHPAAPARPAGRRHRAGPA